MNDLITQMATCLVEDATNKPWDKIEYELIGVTTFWQESAEQYVQDASESIETTDDDEDPNNSPMYYAKQLREVMYQESPDKGAWYTLRLTILATGKFDVQFEYDKKPDFNIEIDEERYVLDYEKYPRDSASMPDWLKTILTKNGRL